VIRGIIARGLVSTALLYLLNLSLFLFNPLDYPFLFALGAASYHVAFLGVYSLWGWVFLFVSFLFAAVVHPSAGIFVGFVGGFVAAAALGVGRWRLFSLLLYVFLYVVLTNLLVFVSVFMPYAVDREYVPDPLHLPLYFVYYATLHLAYGAVVRPRPLWAGKLVF
jgi:hypothetical protein